MEGAKVPRAGQFGRNIFLSAGAASLAIGSLVALVQLMPRDLIESASAPLASNASYGLRLVAYLALTVGLSILAVAILTPRRRERRWRAGAFVLAAGYAGLFFSDLIAMVLVLRSDALLGYSPAAVTASLIILLAVNLWSVAAAVIVAPLFRTASPARLDGSQSNVRLAWAMFGFVVVFAAAMVNEIVTGHRFWDSSALSGSNNVGLIGTVAGILLFVAAAIAAVAFRVAARSRGNEESDALRQREARLALAALCLLVSSILFFEVALALAALLAFVGFAVSRRSLSGATDVRLLKSSDPPLPD
jgi:hypothetical protein